MVLTIIDFIPFCYNPHSRQIKPCASQVNLSTRPGQIDVQTPTQSLSLLWCYVLQLKDHQIKTNIKTSVVRWYLQANGQPYWRYFNRKKFDVAHFSPVWRSVIWIWSRNHPFLLPLPELSCQMRRNVSGPSDDSTLRMKLQMLPVDSSFKTQHTTVSQCR